MGIPKGSFRFLTGWYKGCHRNHLRETLFNVIFGLRQVRPAQVAVENLVGLHLPGLVPSDGAAVTVEKVELRVRYPAASL